MRLRERSAHLEAVVVAKAPRRRQRRDDRCDARLRRRAPEGSWFMDGDRASGMFGVLAGGFAIFASFIIFLAFTTYHQSRSGGLRVHALLRGPRGRPRARRRC